MDTVSDLSEYAYAFKNIIQAYRTYLQVRVVLVYLEIWTDFDRITVSTNPPLLLLNFQQWAQTLSVSFDAALYVT